MPVAAALHAATPATRKAIAAVRMSPPPISTAYIRSEARSPHPILGSPTGRPKLSQMRRRRQPRVVRFDAGHLVVRFPLP
jgi:hypothetical protein